eukprot:410076-Heterocapsa_arctica.AAC.1
MELDFQRFRAGREWGSYRSWWALPIISLVIGCLPSMSSPSCRALALDLVDRTHAAVSAGDLLPWV